MPLVALICGMDRKSDFLSPSAETGYTSPTRPQGVVDSGHRQRITDSIVVVMNPSRHLRGVVPVLLTGFALLCGTIAVKTATCRAGEYLNSAHGQHVSRNDTAAAGYAIGNCAHCHEQHASINGVEPAPVGGTPSAYLGFALEENLCFGCHGFGGLGTATDNIETDITKSYGHNPVNYSGLHKTNETLGDISSNKHVECTDCHNPHRAGSTTHSTGSNAIASTSPLYEVTGVEPTFSSLNWTTPLYGTTLQTATKEYQLCFKCHSGANTNVTSWGGAGAEAFTDVALEFSPSNRSGHPVVTGLNNYTNSLDVNRGSGPYKGLHNEIDGTNWWDQLLDPWGTNAGSQTMYCSDCHASDSTVAGPHGSDVKWMLAGVNKAWPFTTAAANGNSSGTYRAINTLYEWDSTYQQGLGTDDGCFCWNCHPPNRQGNNVHSNGNHRGAKCVDCHLRVPHGGKVSRLIAAENSSSYSSMPARYTAAGNGYNSRGTTQPIVRKFTKAANWSYNRSNCYANISGCQYHKKSSNGSESW